MNNSFNTIAKPVGPICNLDCTYCFYLEKENLYPGEKTWKMPDDVLENFIRQNIHGQNAGTINFLWQGGEPTLAGIDFYKRAVKLQKKFSRGKRITNSLQTNGILIDEDWCEFFKENNFLIGISIDGPKELNDKFRYFKNGNGSFEKTVEAVELLKKFKIEFNTLTVVNKFNAEHPVEIYEFLKSIGAEFMQFIPLVEKVVTDNGRKIRASEISVGAEQYGNLLNSIFNEWVRHDVGKYFIQNFDNALECWMGIPPGLCVFRETCGSVPAIEHNGDVYSCDHFVDEEYLIGNIADTEMNEMMNSDLQIKFGENKKTTLPEYCRKCEVKFACNGGCPKDRFISTHDSEAGLNYLCEGYKKFFNYIDPYMKFMADELKNQRPPANVMNMDEFHI